MFRDVIILVVIICDTIPAMTTGHTGDRRDIVTMTDHRSQLSGVTSHTKKISNTGGRSLDLACVHLDVHCVGDDDNVIDVFFGVSTAEECQLTCEYHPSDCVMFTWFDQLEETFPSSCFLYSRYKSMLALDMIL